MTGGTSRPTPTKGGSSTVSRRDEPYVYSTLQQGTVGLIDYRRCQGLPRFQAFLEATFQSLAAQPIRALIIDLRRNGGGDSRLNDELWTYLTTKPFKQFGGTIVKACDRLKREYGHDKYVDIYGPDAWSAQDRTILRSGMDPNSDLVVPGPLALRFSRPSTCSYRRRHFRRGRRVRWLRKTMGSRQSSVRKRVSPSVRPAKSTPR